MATSKTELQIFVAAPGDIQDERQIVEEIIDEWNTHRGEQTSTLARVVWWRNSARPGFGDRAQALINRQVLDNADIVVGIFWTRFGTPTGEAQSGTEEEILRSIKQGKDVLLYFSDASVPPSKFVPDQFQKVQEFRRSIEAGNNGLYWVYENLDEFRSQFRRHIAESLNTHVGSDNSQSDHVHSHEPKTQSPPPQGQTPKRVGVSAHLPRLQKEFTDRDRQQFLRSAFDQIRSFFEQACRELQEAEPRIAADVIEVTRFLFGCQIYLDGNLRAQCKLWIGGGMFGTKNQICYGTDSIESTNNNSMNGWASVEDDGHELYLNASPFGGHGSNAGKMDTDQAAVYFWKLLTDSLNVD